MLFSRLKQLWCVFRVRKDCFHNEPTRIVNQHYVYYGDMLWRGFGYEEIKRKAYTGQLTNSEEYNGWGYLWSQYDPVYIGRFFENKLNGPGIRITHSSEETKSISLGFWELGRMSGAGLSMQDNWTIVGDFKVVKKIENVETFIKHIPEDNVPFLTSLETKKLENIKTRDNRK